MLLSKCNLYLVARTYNTHMQSQNFYLDLVGAGQKESTDTLNNAQSPPKKFYLDLVGMGQKGSKDTLNTAQSPPESVYHPNN